MKETLAICTRAPLSTYTATHSIEVRKGFDSAVQFYLKGPGASEELTAAQVVDLIFETERTIVW